MTNHSKYKKCIHCQKTIPYAANLCPHCQKRQKGLGCAGAVIIFAMVLLIYSILFNPPKSNNETIDPSGKTTPTEDSRMHNSSDKTPDTKQ